MKIILCNSGCPAHLCSQCPGASAFIIAFYCVSEHSFCFCQISKEVLYGSHSPVHTLSSTSHSTLQSLQGSMSPPMVRSMPSSPSRMAYGGGGTRGAAGLVDPGSATLPRERLSGRSSTLCTSSSAILERRDVKPGQLKLIVTQ